MSRGYALKFDMIDVVVSDSLQNRFAGGEPVGYQFDIRLSYYRGQFLSVIDEFAVAVDGEGIPAERLRFHLGERNFGVAELRECYTEFWNIREPATISVEQPGGLPQGEHQIDVTLFFRSPYMAIGPDHQYMPIDSCGSKALALARKGA